jgi:hypothetical protein
LHCRNKTLTSPVGTETFGRVTEKFGGVTPLGACARKNKAWLSMASINGLN